MNGIPELADTLLEASVVGSFSRLGYAVRSALLPEFRSPVPSMTGRTVLITGATSGIGLAAAVRLARLGAQVTFLARSRERAERARDQITAAAASTGANQDQIQYGLADLTDLDSVRRFGTEFAARIGKLDVLIHNAGAIHDRLSITKDGVELTAASQLIAPFLLTQLLLDPLRAAAPARVITVSSGGMYAQRLDVDGLAAPDPARYRGAARYALVKRGQVELNAQWATRIDRSLVAFHAMHPGWVRTPGLARSLPAFSRLASPLLRTPDQGADTIIWLAAADQRQLGTGQFWHDRRPRPAYRRPGPRPDPPGTGELLWTWVAQHARAYPRHPD
jgi:dehydrogenase/reductase SDR family member 12